MSATQTAQQKQQQTTSLVACRESVEGFYGTSESLGSEEGQRRLLEWLKRHVPADSYASQVLRLADADCLIKIEPIFEGFTNNNYYLEVGSSQNQPNTNVEKSELTKVAVVRRNKTCLDSILNRRQEIDMIKIASEGQLGPRLLFESEEGFCTEFVPATQISCALTHTTEVGCLVAKTLGMLNRLVKEKEAQHSLPNLNSFHAKTQAILATNPQSLYKFDKFTISASEINSTLNFLRKLDEQIICPDSEDIITIHADTNSSNLLYTNIMDMDQSQMTVQTFLEKQPKLFLVDFELSQRASYIYELAIFIYSACGFPRDFSQMPMDSEYFERLSRAYLESFYGAEKFRSLVTASYLDQFIIRLKYAMLFNNFHNLVFQMQYCWSGDAGFNCQETTAADHHFYQSLYMHLFGEASFDEALQIARSKLSQFTA